MNKAQIAAVLGAVVLVGGAFWYTHTKQKAEPIGATVTPIAGGNFAVGATSSTPVMGGVVVSAPATLAISSKDNLSSWSFKGVYSGNAALEQKAQQDIAQTISSLATLTGNNLQRAYIKLGMQYESLGDGKNAYNSYLKVLNTKEQYQENNAVAWAKLGDLLATLGAYNTAAVAYAKSTSALPKEPSLYVARITFLMHYLPQQKADIQAAFAEADKNIPGDASVAQLRAQYGQ